MTEDAVDRFARLALRVSAWAIQPFRLAQLALLGAVLFAYRQLISLDPDRLASTDIDPVEEWFFAASGGTSPLLIYGLTAWLVASRARTLFDTNARATVATTTVGAGGILCALGLVVWSHLTAAYQVLPPSLAVLLISSGFFLAGSKGGRSLLTPSIFLFLLGTPIPTPLLNHVIYPMQLMAAEASASIVRLFGFPVLQAGDLIATEWATFQVIETCAGLRSVLTLLMAAFVYCELLEIPRRQKFILILAAPAIGLAANIMRIVFLIFIPVPESQPAHSIQGIVMTVLGVVVLVGLHEALRRLVGERKVPQGRAPAAPSDPRPPQPESSLRICALAVMLTVTGLASLRIEPWSFQHDDGPGIHAIPREVGAWRTGQNPLIVDADYLGSVRFSSRTWRRYQNAGAVVSLFAGANNRLQRTAGLVSEKTKTLEAGSILVRDSSREIMQRHDGARSVIIRTRRAETLAVLHWYENTAGFWTETIRSMLAIDRSPWRRQEPARVYRISTAIDTSTGGLKGAENRLEEFSILVRKEMADLSPPS